MDKILLFIPCYNCASQIVRVLRQLADPIHRQITEVLVLDNGSTDGTIEAAVAAAAGISYVTISVARNRSNYNLGGSHKAAFAYADKHRFTHVLILHGDDQGTLADVAPILAQNLHNEYDACLGARFARGSRLVGYSRFRIFGNVVFNALFTIGARRRVIDLGSGLNIVGRAVFRDPAVAHYADDLRFNIFLLLGLFDSGKSATFFPISWREDDQVSNVKLWSQASRTLAILRDYAFRREYFRRTDFRTTKHEAYSFDVIHRSAALAPASGVDA
jgi:glycosyltransferase involved in cell wall biosynthesis